MASQTDASNTNPADPTVQLLLTPAVKVHQVNVLDTLCWSFCMSACIIFRKTNETVWGEFGTRRGQFNFSWCRYSTYSSNGTFIISSKRDRCTKTYIRHEIQTSQWSATSVWNAFPIWRTVKLNARKNNSQPRIAVIFAIRDSYLKSMNI
jgi:hypothetical protein